MANTYTGSFSNFPFGPNLFNRNAGLNRGIKTSWFSGSQMVAQGGTTDGTTSEIFETLTNSGTFTATSTQAGYEGEAVSTTGAGSGNQNAFIGTPGFSVDTGQYAVCYAAFYVPDPNVHAYSFWFGLFNKQADPSGTGPTDGAWITGATAAGAIAFVGKSANNSTVSTSATLGTIALGVPRSVELAIAISENNKIQFATRDPSVVTNPWIIINNAAGDNMPRSTVTLRPHLVHYTNTANANAWQIRDFAYAWYRPQAF